MAVQILNRDRRGLRQAIDRGLRSGLAPTEVFERLSTLFGEKSLTGRSLRIAASTPDHADSLIRVLLPPELRYRGTVWGERSSRALDARFQLSRAVARILPFSFIITCTSLIAAGTVLRVGPPISSEIPANAITALAALQTLQLGLLILLWRVSRGDQFAVTLARHVPIVRGAVRSLVCAAALDGIADALDRGLHLAAAIEQEARVNPPIRKALQGALMGLERGLPVEVALAQLARELPEISGNVALASRLDARAREIRAALESRMQGFLLLWYPFTVAVCATIILFAWSGLMAFATSFPAGL